MLSSDRRRDTLDESQFSLLSLLGFVTVCGILSALAGVVGVVASGLLMLMALALWARQGLLALALLMAICLGADAPFQPRGEDASFARQVLVILVAAGLCGWYCLRRAGQR